MCKCTLTYHFMSSIQAAKHTDLEKVLLRNIYDRYDADKNDEVTTEELRTTYADMGYPLSDLEIANIIGQMDKNSSGTIDFDEFCVYWGPKSDAEAKRAKSIEAFHV